MRSMTVALVNPHYIRQYANCSKGQVVTYLKFVWLASGSRIRVRLKGWR